MRLGRVPGGGGAVRHPRGMGAVGRLQARPSALAGRARWFTAPLGLHPAAGLQARRLGLVARWLTAVLGLRSVAGLHARPFALAGRARWLTALLGLLPAEVLACPSCTVRAPESGVRSVLMVVALMLSPLVLVGVGIWAARRAARDEPEERG